MDSILKPWLPLSLLLSLCYFPLSFTTSPHRHLLQSTPAPPENLQTSFPSTAIPALLAISPPPQPSSSTAATASSPTPEKKSDDNKRIAAAVAITAASSFALSGLLFFAFHRFTAKRRRLAQPTPMPNGVSAAAGGAPFRYKPDPALKGVIIENNGLDVLYWRSLDSSAPRRCDRCNRVLRGGSDGEEEDEDEASPEEEQRQRRRRDPKVRRSQEAPLLPSDSLKSSSRIFGDAAAAPPPTPPIPPLAPPTPPAPPPPPKAAQSPSPPPPPVPGKKGPAVPPPPPRRVWGPPPPAPATSSRPPAAPTMNSGKERPRLKPLHWDKVTPANAGQSMVWDKITDGSMRFDDDLMEALFGYVATNRKLPNSSSGESSSGASGKPDVGASSSSPAQIFLLEPRKSQNIAIVLRTLTVSRREILDGLRDGHGLPGDTLEKLSRITPTKEEETKIFNFSGNPSNLADGESFLFHILRAVPSAFPRIAAMNFRSSVYEPEILHLKLSLQTLELACKELRNRGLFLKLLEAILKAGNRMNAGTARGDAQAFDLAALQKLSDVKSTDGKTNLLHFVVEEVVRSEGKRCAAVNRSHSIRRSASRNAGGLGSGDQAREEREREYIMLGLPIVGGLSVEFTNVKKAAVLDYDSIAGGCAGLAARVLDIRQFLRGFGDEEEGGFAREMNGFVEAAAGEIEAVEGERGRVMEMVKRTTEYYKPGAAKSSSAPPLQLFVIVRDFLGMVDQACVNITRNLQKKKAVAEGTPESSPAAAVQSEERITTRFPNLPARFMSENSLSSSDSEDDGF